MTASTVIAPQPRTHSLVFPLLLITVGIAILLSNAGYLSNLRWTDALALWPLLLVLAGVDMLLRPRSYLAAGVVEVAIILVAIAYLLSGVAVAPPASSHEVTVPRSGASDVSLTVNYGGGDLRFAGGAMDLVSVRSTRENVTRTVDQNGASATVALSSNSDGLWSPVGRNFAEWDVTLASDVRTSATLNLGAGTFDVDLSAIRLVRATINTGASDLTLRLPQPKGDVPIAISTGMSQVQIDVPTGVEYRIDETGVMQSISGARQSAGYAAATDRVTIRLSAGLSSITVR